LLGMTVSLMACIISPSMAYAVSLEVVRSLRNSLPVRSDLPGYLPWVKGRKDQVDNMNNSANIARNWDADRRVKGNRLKWERWDISCRFIWHENVVNFIRAPANFRSHTIQTNKPYSSGTIRYPRFSPYNALPGGTIRRHNYSGRNFCTIFFWVSPNCYGSVWTQLQVAYWRKDMEAVNDLCCRVTASVAQKVYARFKNSLEQTDLQLPANFDIATNWGLWGKTFPLVFHFRGNKFTAQSTGSARDRNSSIKAKHSFKGEYKEGRLRGTFTYVQQIAHSGQATSKDWRHAQVSGTAYPPNNLRINFHNWSLRRWQQRSRNGSLVEQQVTSKDISDLAKAYQGWPSVGQSVSGTTEETNIEAEEKAKAEEQARIEAEEKRKAEEEVAKVKEEEARRRAEEEAKAEADEKAKAEEEAVRERARIEAEKEAKAKEKREAGESLPPWVPAAAGAAAGTAAATGALLMMAASGVRPKEVWDGMKDLMSQGTTLEEPPSEEQSTYDEAWEQFKEERAPYKPKAGDLNEKGKIYDEAIGGWVEREDHEILTGEKTPKRSYAEDDEIQKAFKKVLEEEQRLRQMEEQHAKNAIARSIDRQREKVDELEKISGKGYNTGEVADLFFENVEKDVREFKDGIEKTAYKVRGVMTDIYRDPGGAVDAVVDAAGRAKDMALDAGTKALEIGGDVIKAGADTVVEVVAHPIDSATKVAGFYYDTGAKATELTVNGMKKVYNDPIGTMETAWEGTKKVGEVLISPVTDIIDENKTLGQRLTAVGMLVLDVGSGGAGKASKAASMGVDAVDGMLDARRVMKSGDTLIDVTMDARKAGRLDEGIAGLGKGVSGYKPPPLTDPKLIAKREQLTLALDAGDDKKILELYQNKGMKDLAELEKAGHITPKQAERLNEVVGRTVDDAVEKGTRSSVSAFQKENNVRIKEVLVGDSGSSAKPGGPPRSVKTDADRTLVPVFDEDTMKKYAHRENMSVEQAHDQLCQKFETLHTKEVGHQLKNKGLVPDKQALSRQAPGSVIDEKGVVKRVSPEEQALENLDYKNYDRIAPKSTNPRDWDDKAKSLMKSKKGALPSDDVYAEGYTSARQSLQGKTTIFKVDAKDGSIRSYKTSGDTLVDQNQLTKAAYENADLRGTTPTKIRVEEMSSLLNQQKKAAVDYSDTKSLAKAVDRASYAEQRLKRAEIMEGRPSGLKSSLDPGIKSISKEVLNNPQQMGEVLHRHGLSHEEFVGLAKKEIEGL